jgi:DNA-binding GntR family transcriptional regulator
MAAIRVGNAAMAEKLMHDHILCGREALARMEARAAKQA